MRGRQSGAARRSKGWENSICSSTTALTVFQRFAQIMTVVGRQLGGIRVQEMGRGILGFLVRVLSEISSDIDSGGPSETIARFQKEQTTVGIDIGKRLTGRASRRVRDVRRN